MDYKRLQDVDRAKGFAIILVVVGHLASYDHSPIDASWYLDLKDLIYHFHMPFFMFLSGFLYFYHYKKVQSVNEYMIYLGKKANRLIPTFIIFSVLILFGKVFAVNFMPVQTFNEIDFSGIVNIVIDPSRSVAISLWYIYVLFELLLIMPIVVYLVCGSSLGMIILGLILYFLPNVPHVFMLDSVCHYFIFFVLGKFVIDYNNFYQAILRHPAWSYGFFLLSFISIKLFSPEVAKLIIGTASIPSLHSLVYSGVFRNSDLLLRLGQFSFVIYLLNTIIIGVFKGVLINFMPWSGWYFNLVYFPLLVISAIFLPIWLKENIFPHFNYVDRITS